MFTHGHGNTQPDHFQYRVGAQTLSLTNLNKMFYPDVGFTKRDVISYYYAVCSFLLPHLRNRPITLKRYPDGVASGYFYEKRCPSYKPNWLETAAIDSINYCLIQDVESLIWLANIADLEIHSMLFTTRDEIHPTAMVFDLDPGEGASIINCCEIALELKCLFDDLLLESFPKTSGLKGLQLYVPLNLHATFDQTKTFSQTVARLLEDRHPKQVTASMARKNRKGKVYIDWVQNDQKKTTVSVYSLRAGNQPTVSTPLSWEEVRHAAERGRPDELRFTPEDVLLRVRRHGDLFRPVLTKQQELPFI